jgi:hypothetical protein
MLLTAVILLVEALRLQTSGVTTTGIVIGYDRSCEGESEGCTRWATVRFTTADGQTAETSLDLSVEYGEGDSVRIVYVPSDPTISYSDISVAFEFFWGALVLLAAFLIPLIWLVVRNRRGRVKSVDREST